MAHNDANQPRPDEHPEAAARNLSLGPTADEFRRHQPSLVATLGARGATLVRLAAECPALASLAITAGLFAAVFLAFTPSFQTNDDPQMMMIAAGRGSGLSPDEHLVFSNVLIGHVLKALYSAAPAIPWYGAYLLAIQLLAYATLLYCVMRPGFTVWRLLLFLLYFAVVGVFAINQLQFTAVASLAVQCGLLALFTALRERSARPDARVVGLLVAAAGLIVLGSLVRLGCVVPIAIIAGVCALGWLGWPRRRAIWVPAIATAAVCGALVFAAAAYNRAYYNRDPAWQSFWRYNALRLQFNDYGLIRYSPETASVFDAVHWSHNDQALIARWFYDDPAVYSEANLRQIVDATQWRTSQVVRDNVIDFFGLLVADRSLRPLLLLLPLLIWGRDRNTRAGRAACLGGAAAFALLVALAMQTKPPPSRVYSQLLVLPLGVLLLAARDTMRLPRRRWPRLAVRCFAAPWSWSRPGARQLLAPTWAHGVLLLAAVGLVMALHREGRRSRRIERERAAVRETFAQVADNGEEPIVLWGGGFPLEVISPLDSLGSFGERRVLMIGWPQHTPNAQRMRQYLGVESLPDALKQGRRVRFLGVSDHYDRLSEFLREHYDLDLVFHEQYRGGHGFDLAGQFLPPRALANTANRASAADR